MKNDRDYFDLEVKMNSGKVRRYKYVTQIKKNDSWGYEVQMQHPDDKGLFKKCYISANCKNIEVNWHTGDPDLDDCTI